jgi:alcohol-forming fatty acyl-CoA reductase
LTLPHKHELADQPVNDRPANPVYWRVEGSLLNLSVVRPIAFFTWRGQSFLERCVRRGLMLLMAVLRPFLYAVDRVMATRVVHTVLRGVSRDRVDLLGEEYFQYHLKPRLKSAGLQALKQVVDSGAEVVLVSQGLDHVMRPLAQHLGVKWLLANRLDLRDGIATGRLLRPVIRPRGLFARITGSDPNGRKDAAELGRNLDLAPELLAQSVFAARREQRALVHPVVLFDGQPQKEELSVRKALSGKHVLLVGFTGFIGKVWLANTLADLPEIGKIYLLIRRQKSNPAVRRFEKVMDESPVFDKLGEQYGAEFARFIAARIEVVEGDVTRPMLGLDAEVAERLQRCLDVAINSSGLTDFNPDLRDALAVNVDATAHMLDFIRGSDHAGLVHLSTCYVAGQRDGRISETLRRDYTPARVEGFEAEKEWQELHARVAEAEKLAESPEITEELRREAFGREHAARGLQGAALDNQIRKNRIRWLKTYITEVGMARARELGWPNTYTFTKSLAESLIATRGAGLPVAIVRPAIVETSIAKPFLGWNEGINTSASLSYLLGTYFRQLPTNERKRLDIVPVDSVCQGITLIATAVIERRHDAMYQLATSVANPCDMRRSIELTGLAHRKHYRALEGIEHWLRLHFDTIPVSKQRYQRLSAPAQRTMVRTIQKIMAPLPLKKMPLARTERSLERLEKLIVLFEPFILNNEHDFVAGNVEKLNRLLPEEERETFGYDSRSLDWWEYWINIHIPALRRWTYPLIEGRPLEARPSRNFRLSLADDESKSREPNGDAQTLQTGTGPTWQYS